MRYIHCTQKLIKEINPKIESKGLEREVKGFGDWYANVFGFEKTANIIFMNVKTLYSFVVPDIYLEDIENFEKTFVFGLNKSLEGINVSKDLKHKIIEEYSEIEIVKTKSKSIISSMNDHIYHFISCFEKGSPSLIKTVDDFNKSILKVPSGAMKYKTPLEKFNELIENEFLN
jgi:hypothetical protein